MPDATVFPVLSRHRDREFSPNGLQDFTLGPGRTAFLDTLADPEWSLYALDLVAGTAIFTRLAPGTLLSSAAFIPKAQFLAATEVLTLPIDALAAAAALVPQPAKRIFLFSIGRCGTTLAHHILNTVPGVLALSEPRAFVTLAMARHQMTEDRAQALIAATTRLMFRPTAGQEVLSIKLHSQALFQAGLYRNAFPDARFLFLYRDGLGWANSFSRFMQNLGMPLALEPEAVARYWSILTANAPTEAMRPWLDPSVTSGHAPVLAAGWAMAMAEVQRLESRGMAFQKLRYDDLNGDRATAIGALLDHCGLPHSHMAKALAAFDRDSQEGTVIGRGGSARGFSAEDEAQFRATLAKGPGPLTFDLRL